MEGFLMAELTKNFSELKKLIEAHHFNGALAVVNKTQVLFEGAGGYAKFDMSVPFSAETPTGVGPLGQQLVIAALLRLVEDGQLKLSQKVSDFIPEYAHAKEISIKQLMNQTAGLPSYSAVIAKPFYEDTDKQVPTDRVALQIDQHNLKGMDFEDVLDVIGELPLAFKPGEKSEYSDSNAVFLGEILDRATDERPVEAILKDYVYDPVGMTETKLGTEHSFAQNYKWIANNPDIIGRGQFDLTDAGLVSSLHDMEKWAQTVLARKLLKGSTWEEALAVKDGHYGYGWLKSGQWYQFGGQQYGYSGDIHVSLDKGVATVWLSNVAMPDSDVDAWSDALQQFRETL
ncbi:Beta-lactamase class C related penicillin binding protein [Schleiferilactobacillus perolens DSM 12744]|uniref:Beta-lactamase class C related penicillin binding protein n=2 Tax=Schleiferilactobacillus perolens TaxID=100468 RepID=A0A0R1NAM2_9LACO|nr:Beta-lactamase class C related penicillin binding protein [Schleiferilactobacillus perolens DSM 12744]